MADSALDPRRGRSVVLSLGLFFVALFLGMGASMPFMPVWFRAQGLGPTQMAVILAAPYFGRSFIGPLLAVWADRFRLRRTPVAWMAAASGAAFLTLAVFHGFWGWLTAWFIGSTLLGALSPLVDVIALREASRLGFSYSTPRGVGSAAYLVGNVAMGLVLARMGPASVLAWTIGATGLTALFAAWFLPPTPVQHMPREATPNLASLGEQIASLGALLREPSFLLALVAVGLIQATHGFYYSFSILIWRQQGLSIWGGPLWGFAVGAEVLFMWFMEPFRRRLGPERLLIVGGLGALLRWIAFAFSPPLWALFPLQALHGVSFTATYLAGLRLIEQRSPAQSASAAQALNAALSSGILIGVTTAVSGPLFAVFGAKGYLVMAVLATIGVGLAVWLARSPRLITRRAPAT